MKHGDGKYFQCDECGRVLYPPPEADYCSLHFCNNNCKHLYQHHAVITYVERDVGGACVIVNWPDEKVSEDGAKMRIKFLLARS